MTKHANPQPSGNAGKRTSDDLNITADPGQSEARARAEVHLDPAGTATAAAFLFSEAALGEVDLTEFYIVLQEQIKAVSDGDLSLQCQMLASQAAALNSIFAGCVRRAAGNMGDYPDAMDRYMRIGLKAQAQSRATIEALDKLINGREQVVRHVTVHEGGQAVVAGTINTGGRANAFDPINPHTTGATGQGPALLGQDTQGNSVPISGDAERPVPDARGSKPRRRSPKGKS